MRFAAPVAGPYDGSMTVFIAHAPADRSAAEALEKVIERRGQFVELDDGQTALKPVQSGDAFVLLVSQALLFATARLRLEQRALDAWAAGRLIVVKLDNGVAPVGLRDLPAIDASFEAQREFKWNEVADAIREALTAARRPHAAPEDGDEAAPPQAPAKKRGGGGVWPWLVAFVLAAPGLAAIAATMSIWLVNRIGPTPGGWPELVAALDAFGGRFGAPSGVTLWLFAGAIVATVCAFAWAIAQIVSRAGAPRIRAEPVRASDAVFVSYARANETQVMPVIEAAKRAGRKFWLDKQGLTAGDGWAGEIVRAIRGAAGVVVMCSKAAFESDHVKREIYLADRYKKKLVPVFIEAAEPPEDFEYFFAGVQSLNLFETPEAERPQALVRALGAAA